MESTAQRLLKSASDTIGNRAAERDVKQERSMADTVAAFNAMFGTNLTESQGWAFMVFLKMKRATTGGYRPDDFTDGSAYFALMGESCESASNRQMLAEYSEKNR